MCAASRSLSENKNILQNIVRISSPTVIGGVQKKATGICFDDEGTFSDLGTVGVTVGAEVSIISVCQLIDTGRYY